MKINLINAMMGAGKSTAIIEYMDNALTKYDKKKFVYISPNLAEVSDYTDDDGKQVYGRINTALAHHDVTYPRNLGKGKTGHFMDMIESGQSISSTHACFKNLSMDDIATIRDAEYDLIIDESMDAIEQYQIPTIHLRALINSNALKVDPVTSRITWNHLDYPVDKIDFDEWATVAKLCDQQAMYLINSTAFVLEFPIEILQAFKSVTVMTYLFEGTTMAAWCKMHNIEVVDITDTINLIHTEAHLKAIAREKLHVYQPKTDIKFGLSQSWFTKAKATQFGKLKSQCTSFMKNSAGKNDSTLITCPKDYWQKLKGQRYSKATWLHSGCRATNAYSDKTHVIYALNKHPHVLVRQHMLSADADIVQDKYALSEMLQFLWRGCIRNGEDMHVLVINPRMRKLLTDWLAE